MKTAKLLMILLSVGIFTGCMSAPVEAVAYERHDNYRGGDNHGNYDHREWNHREPPRHYESRLPHGGYWRHEHHDGRIGWWWIVGPRWIFVAG